MNRKRLLEFGSAAVLVVVLAVLAGAWLHYRGLNERLERMLEDPNLDRAERETVHRLLRQGASPFTRREDGYHLLMLAARNGDLPLLRELLRRGLDPNCADMSGHTPLMEAMVSRSDECARVLLEAGADVNARDAWGRTPLMWAAWFQNRPGILLLLARGADASARNGRGETALVYVGRHPGLVRLLKERGAPGTRTRAPAASP